MEQNVWLKTLNTAPEHSNQSTVIKHHLNQVKTYQLDMLLKHPGYDGDVGRMVGGLVDEYQFFVQYLLLAYAEGF